MKFGLAFITFTYEHVIMPFLFVTREKLWLLTQVERLSHELFPWATRCAKDAVLCGINYTGESRRSLNSTSLNELKQHFYR